MPRRCTHSAGRVGGGRIESRQPCSLASGCISIPSTRPKANSAAWHSSYPLKDKDITLGIRHSVRIVYHLHTTWDWESQARKSYPGQGSSKIRRRVERHQVATVRQYVTYHEIPRRPSENASVTTPNATLFLHEATKNLHLRAITHACSGIVFSRDLVSTPHCYLAAFEH